MVGHPRERSGKVLPLDQTSYLGIPSASDMVVITGDLFKLVHLGTPCKVTSGGGH